MPKSSRQMRLGTRHLAQLVYEATEEQVPAGLTLSTGQDHQDTMQRLLAQAPDTSEIWFFAYGSLIWKPACDFVELRTGLVRGWHRSFCLGWNERHRGNPQNPGLMLALDRGGACKGALYRLPPDAVAPNFIKLLEREMSFKPSAFPPRWVKAETANGPITALTFAMDRKSGRYVSGLSNAQIADVLSSAVGARGSMAEYLFSTVKHLEEMGIHDPHLWELQDLVADRIEARHGLEQG